MYAHAGLMTNPLSVNVKAIVFMKHIALICILADFSCLHPHDVAALLNLNASG